MMSLVPVLLFAASLAYCRAHAAYPPVMWVMMVPQEEANKRMPVQMNQMTVSNNVEDVNTMMEVSRPERFEGPMQLQNQHQQEMGMQKHRQQMAIEQVRHQREMAEEQGMVQQQKVMAMRQEMMGQQSVVSGKQEQVTSLQLHQQEMERHADMMREEMESTKETNVVSKVSMLKAIMIKMGAMLERMQVMVTNVQGTRMTGEMEGSTLQARDQTSSAGSSVKTTSEVKSGGDEGKSQYSHGAPGRTDTNIKIMMTGSCRWVGMFLTSEGEQCKYMQCAYGKQIRNLIPVVPVEMPCPTGLMVLDGARDGRILPCSRPPTGDANVCSPPAAATEEKTKMTSQYA